MLCSEAISLECDSSFASVSCSPETAAGKPLLVVPEQVRKTGGNLDRC